MKRVLVPILALTIIMTMGCEKESTTEGTNDSCILQKISFSIPDGSAGYDIDFTYDSQDRLVEVKKTEYDIGDPYIRKYNIEYSGDGVNKITSSNSLTNNGERYYFYYAGGIIDSVEIRILPDDEYWSRRYIKVHYDGDKVSRLDFYNNNVYEGKYLLGDQMDILWQGENVIQAGDWQYTYDDKPSALRHIGMAFTDYESMAMLSNNNVITTKYGPNFSRNYTYTYNEHGYPVTLDNGFDQGPVNYDYSCK